MYSLAGHWLFVGIMTTKMTHFASDDDDKNKGYKPEEKDDDKDGEPHIENDADEDYSPSPCMEEAEMPPRSDMGASTSDSGSSLPQNTDSYSRRSLLDLAVAGGDDQMVRMLRRAIEGEERKAHGRSSNGYTEMTERFNLEDKVWRDAKRARIREAKEESIAESDAKRLAATALRKAIAERRKAIAESAARDEAKKRSEAADAEKKRYSTWLQTQFPAKHAAIMIETKAAMGEEDTRHTVTTMTKLQVDNKLKRWISIDDPWTPDPTLLQEFGSLPNRDGRFDKASRRVVRCSPQFDAFIHHIGYKHPQGVPNPTSALHFVLKACFVKYESMFVDSHSPYQLLCRSQMILDMAFVLAVRLASAWLGPMVMPAGYFPTWPPPEGD